MKLSADFRYEINSYDNPGYVKIIRVDRPTSFFMKVTKYEYDNKLYVSEDMYSVRIGNQITDNMEDMDISTITSMNSNIQKLTNYNQRNVFFIKIENDGVYICTKKGGRYTIDIVETFYSSSISVTFLNNVAESDRMVELTDDCIKESANYQDISIINSGNVIRYFYRSKELYQFINTDRFLINEGCALKIVFPIDNRICYIMFNVSYGSGNPTDYILSGEFAGERTNPFVGYFYSLTKKGINNCNVYTIIDASYKNIELYITGTNSRTIAINCINFGIKLQNIQTEVIQNFDKTKFSEIAFLPTTGDSDSRPTGVNVGYLYYDTTLKKPIWWNGSSWKDKDGNPADTVNTGTTVERPTNVQIGFIYKDITLNKLIVWEGSKWVNMDGTSLE